MRRWFAALAALLATAVVLASAPHRLSALAAGGSDVPHYDHILVIVEENKDYAPIFDRGYAPNIGRLAATYGTA